MAAALARVYDVSTYRKHKRPKGWGSLCPDDVTLDDASQLLQSGVVVGGAVFAVRGTNVFRAFEHEPNRWHGHPIPWSRLPVDAARALIAQGNLDEATWRKALRKAWGAEFAQ